MALLYPVNSEVSHQVERPAQKCFPLPHFYFHEILLLQLPPQCPGAAGVGRYQQEQFGQAMHAVQSDPFPLRERHGLGSLGSPCISCLFARLPFHGRLEKLLSHATRPTSDDTPLSRVITLCSVTQLFCIETLRT